MRKFNKKINRRKSLIQLFLFSILMLMVSAIGMTYGADLLEYFSIITPGMCLAIMPVMADIGNIEGTTDYESSGDQICNKIYLIHVKQLNPSVAFPLPINGQVGTIPLKSGEKMYSFEIIPGSAEDKSNGTKGDVTTEVKNTLSFIIGGNKQKALKFMKDFAGEGFIVLYQMADDSKWYIMGSALKPMYLSSFERTNNKTQRSVQFTFENTSYTQVNEYIGTITIETPTSLAADAVAIAFTTNDNYVTSNANAAAKTISSFTGLTGSDIGRYITIQGGGGTNVTSIAATAAFILKDDETWNGTLGSVITFKVLDTTTLVEQSRIQRS